MSEARYLLFIFILNPVISEICEGMVDFRKCLIISLTIRLKIKKKYSFDPCKKPFNLMLHDIIRKKIFFDS